MDSLKCHRTLKRNEPKLIFYPPPPPSTTIPLIKRPKKQNRTYINGRIVSPETSIVFRIIRCELQPHIIVSRYVWKRRNFSDISAQYWNNGWIFIITISNLEPEVLVWYGKHGNAYDITTSSGEVSHFHLFFFFVY